MQHLKTTTSTDEAFAALPEGTVATLLLPENKDQLIAILTYHVVSGKVMSGDLSDGMTAATVQGGDVTIMTEGRVTVNGANVVSADIEASNGVIHVIDAVILPEKTTALGKREKARALENKLDQFMRLCEPR
jgi:uncharacterized surface protein with fasciclin (FAS1) repeats|tara:strand:+ start:1634 stop:2029 length:396 start_codon:yes stop_codon:yes gene_type:complete